MKRIQESQKRWLQLFRTNVAYWVAAGICAPFLSAYYKSIGLTSSQIGVLFAASPICAICIQPLWAWVSDHSGKRKTILAALAVCTAAASLLYYAGKSFAVCFFATMVLSMFSSALLPLCDAIVIDRASAYQCNFATIRIGGTLGFALIVFLAGFLLERHPSVQFLLSCGAYLVFALVVLRIPMDGGPEKAPKSVGHSSAQKGIFVSREVAFVLLFAFVESVGLGFSGSFTGVYAVELGYSQRLIGILSCVSALSEVPILLCARKLTKRFGEIPLLAFSAVMASLRLFLVGLGAVPTMVGAQLLQSVTYMTTYYCCTQYISSHVRQGKMSQGQSVLAAVQAGLASVSANLLGGQLVDRVGTRGGFHAMAAFVLAVSLLVIGSYMVYSRRKGAADEKFSAI